jgi:hypothetical protein
VRLPALTSTGVITNDTDHAAFGVNAADPDPERDHDPRFDCGSCWCTNSGLAISRPLGVYVSGRTREKVSAATGQDAPGAIEKLVQAVVKKK